MRDGVTWVVCGVVMAAVLLASGAAGAAEPGAAEPAGTEPSLRPTMGELMGVNGHTVQFKAELYAKVCRKARDYHSFEWDVGRDTDFVTRFPEARNRVNWERVYGSWQAAGFETDVCVMFNNTPPDAWKDLRRDARAYGTALAKAFGPSSPRKLVASVEIGNEPGKYGDERYRELFAAMAEGLREGDAKLKIATCNMTVGKSGKYDKSVECVAGLESLYDVLTIHSYAMGEGWPTWRRSYPEDPQIEYLKSVEKLIAWRDAHAKDKEIWVTEFGWDASTKPPHKTGDFAKWEGNVSDEQQAQYLVRSFLVFAGMEVTRAYLYFFNDADEPSLHAASGITRNFEPKASFHAVGHLYRTLGAYRFARAIAKRQGETYAYEFVHADDAGKKVVVAWSPTGAKRTAQCAVPIGRSRLMRAERMPLSDAKPAAVDTKVESADGETSVTVRLEEGPVYLFVEGEEAPIGDGAAKE